MNNKLLLKNEIISDKGLLRAVMTPNLGTLKGLMFLSICLQARLVELQLQLR